MSKPPGLPASGYRVSLRVQVQTIGYIFILDWSVESESLPWVARLSTRGLGCEYHLALLRKVLIPNIERPLRAVNGLGSTSGLNTSDKRVFAQSFS